MQSSRFFKTLAISGLIAIITATGVYNYAVAPHHSTAPPASAQGLLDRADALAWGNRWADAASLYRDAETRFLSQHQPSKALYARVSQIPPNESVSIPATILILTQDLARPEAADQETKLRILVVRGMLEINYDATQARSTWQQVYTLAKQLHHYELATRATGEQGIAAFLVGDTDTAKKQVLLAWELSRVERDPAATVRYESVFGEGLVHLHRYNEALTPLNEAVRIASTHPEVAYPTIALYTKIEALAVRGATS